MTLTKRQFGIEIAWAGGNEEFHQKKGNYFMFDYWKNKRLKLEQQYHHAFPR